nr:glycerophosphodiester phosphodiesterase family protein [Pacificoceanicola onchidii]
MPALPKVFLDRPIAHRGYHDTAAGRPENSRAAFAAAINAGYSIELDLQLSRDDAAMVFHDYQLQRLTPETGAIRRRTVQELADIPLKHGDEGIPTLAEVLDLVAGRVPLLIELKDQDGAMGAGVGALEQATVAALEGYNGPAALMSFNPHSVVQLAQMAPEIPRGITTCGYTSENWPTLPDETRRHLRNIPDLGRAQADFISHDWVDLSSPAVAQVKSRGLPVLCWTVCSPSEEARARRVADNVTFEGYRA